MEQPSAIRAAVLNLGGALPVVEMPAREALGLVLAEDIVAEGPVPSFVNSSMDGFAVRADDTQAQPVVLRVIGRVGAGSPVDPSLSVGPGEAMRIMTGAALPPGADAVVMVEHTAPGPQPDTVSVSVSVSPGTALRHPGEDIEQGATVLRSGTALTAAHLGLLAIAGRASVQVHRRPVVGVLSTGDELCDPPAPLAAPRIRDANRPALLGLVATDGAVAIDLGIVADLDDVLDAALADATARCDLVLTSGGVSMGDRDLMKARLTSVQAAIRPAKPFAYGVIAGTPVLGLPGNPVSALVSYTLFARPLLRRLAGYGADRLGPHTERARLATPVGRRPDGKTHLLRVSANAGPDTGTLVAPLGGQASHQLAALAEADALALIPDGDGLGEGATVEIIRL